MKTKDERVHPARFKKKLELDGIDNLQDAMNVLSIFQSWRLGECVRSMEELGLRPDLLSAALHYVLSKHNAQKPLFRCSVCKHNVGDIRCNIGESKCRFERIKP